MKPYKKRARGGYCDGKTYKKEANKSERMFEKEQIQRELEPKQNTDELGSSGKRICKKKWKYPEEKKIKKIKNRIQSNQRFLEKFNSEKWPEGWVANIRERYKQDNKRYNKELEELKQTLEEKKKNEKV